MISTLDLQHQFELGDRVCLDGAAVVAVAGYKWLLSPYGTGVTYVHPDWIERFRLPTFNWATIIGADDFNKLVDLEPRQRHGAIRFDVPETAAFIHGRALAESLEFLGEVGVERINAHVIARPTRPQPRAARSARRR